MRRVIQPAADRGRIRHGVAARAAPDRDLAIGASSRRPSRPRSSARRSARSQYASGRTVHCSASLCRPGSSARRRADLHSPEPRAQRAYRLASRLSVRARAGPRRGRHRQPALRRRRARREPRRAGAAVQTSSIPTCSWPDIIAAVDLMVARGFARIALAGVCSGAYMALVAAHADPRITDVVAVNAPADRLEPARERRRADRATVCAR